jgi:1,4-dihydroxy-2-naphthoyl-CoA hydrolase
MKKTPWFRDYTLDELKSLSRGSMVAHLGIRMTEIGTDFLSGTMPVDHRTCQPAGLLHGGASVALAETLGSFAANLCVDPEHKACVGQEVSASHLRSVRKGVVTGTARPVHLGRSSQVWRIDILDERGRLVCVSRLTVAVVASGHGGGKLIMPGDRLED